MPYLFTHRFISSSFNDAFNCDDYTESNARVVVNNEMERMWKEGNIVYFRASSGHFAGEMRKTMEDLTFRNLAYYI